MRPKWCLDPYLYSHTKIELDRRTTILRISNQCENWTKPTWSLGDRRAQISFSSFNGYIGTIVSNFNITKCCFEIIRIPPKGNFILNAGFKLCWISEALLNRVRFVPSSCNGPLDPSTPFQIWIIGIDITLVPAGYAHVWATNTTHVHAKFCNVQCSRLFRHKQ